MDNLKDLDLRKQSIVSPGALIGRNSVIEPFCIIGHPPPTTTGFVGITSVRIGTDAVIRSGTVIYGSVTIGDRLDCSHHVYIREGSTLGNDVYLMSHTSIGREVTVGNRCRLMGRITDGVVIGDDVISLGFLADDKYAGRAGSALKDPPRIGDRATVGANATVLEGVTVGIGAFVAAGAVVTRDVDDFTIVAGVPARVIGDVKALDGWGESLIRELPSSVGRERLTSG